VKGNRPSSSRQTSQKETDHVDAHDIALSVDGRQVAALFRNGSVVFGDGPVSFAVVERLTLGLLEKARRYHGGAR